MLYWYYQQGRNTMRLSPDYYPEYVDYHCFHCNNDVTAAVDSIDGDDVRVVCTVIECEEASYVRVID